MVSGEEYQNYDAELIYGNMHALEDKANALLESWDDPRRIRRGDRLNGVYGILLYIIENLEAMAKIHGRRNTKEEG